MRFRRIARIVKLILVAVLVLCSRRSRAAEPRDRVAFGLDGQTEVLPALVSKQVAILPLARKAGAAVDPRKYLTFDEGLRSGKVTASEQGPAGSSTASR